MLRNCIEKISKEEIKCVVLSIHVPYTVLSSLMDKMEVFKIWPACSDYCYNYASKLQKEQLKCEWGIGKYSVCMETKLHVFASKGRVGSSVFREASLPFQALNGWF